MKVMVTGAAGFIGSHLCDSLLAQGHAVIGLDDFSHGPHENLAAAQQSPAFCMAELDVRATAELCELAAGCDVVVHLAALKIPRYGAALDTVTVNIDGARSALEASRVTGARCVLASTSDVYGKNTQLPFREDSDCVVGPSTSRRWAYATSKLAVEHMAYGYRDEYDLSVSVLRFFGTYGERQYLNWWGGPQGVFLEAIASGQPIDIHGDGSQTRCFIFIDDLVRGVVAACEREEADGEIFNIGTTEEISIRDLAIRMHELSGLGHEPAMNLIPYESFDGSYEDVRRRVPDMTKARALLDFEPVVGLDDGIRRLWDWYRALPAGRHAARAVS